MGYHRAGFDVIGVDIKPQPRYPFEFHCADALEFVAKYGCDFDLIHASPPCQLYSVTASLSNGNHPDLIAPVRKALQSTGKPYVIENVPGAPLINPLLLCGSMFPELRVIRHRLFETSPIIWWPPQQHTCRMLYTNSGHGQHSAFSNGATAICVVGCDFKVADARIAMDIDWMTGKELTQAIPPAYTKYIGEYLIEMRCF